MNERFTKKVLVIEDDEDLRELIIYNMTRVGYEVFSAASGLEAIWFLADQHPDMVITDLLMPSPDGWEICDFLAQTYPNGHIPLVVISARNSPQDVQKILSGSVSAFIPKPFSIQGLMDTVRRVI